MKKLIILILILAIGFALHLYINKETSPILSQIQAKTSKIQLNRAKPNNARKTQPIARTKSRSAVQDDCCDPCEPCCTPEPKKCIDCECFTPAFYDLECDCGFFGSVDFLYWYGRETNLTYASKVEVVLKTTDPMVTNEVFAPQSYTDLGAGWNPGVRLAAGWNSSCDGWDLGLEWTYYHNRKSGFTSVPPDFAREGSFGDPSLGQSVLINPWINPSFAVTHTPTFFADINAVWKLNINTLDLDLGRKYWLSSCFVLRPFAAIRSGWTKVNFDTTSTRTAFFSSNDFIVTFKDRFTTQYWGVGMVLGLEPTWYFCNNFALFGTIDASLLWGEFTNKKSENYREDRPRSGIGPILATNYSNSYSSSFFMMKPILDLALGLRWEETWCCNRYRTALDLGWEHHVWFDHNHRKQPQGFLDTHVATKDDAGGLLGPRLVGYRSFQEAQGNLMMGGFILRARFDF